MSANTEFDTLIKRVQKRIGKEIPKATLEELFFLGEDAYERHNPRSVGKHLTILSIEFSGLKKNGELIAYSRKPKPGVNLWVGDNLVGKSSIFKVVKFVLTGKNSLDREIANWIREIWVEFTLGELVYSAHIYKGPEDKNFVFEFYNASQAALQESDEEGILAARAYAGSMDGYMSFIEKFFFKEFDYYNMQWTAKNSGKSDIGLSTANASWRTYFKSIYLEAEDYKTLMFGAQSELVLQMLLGLELTLPINRLKVKKEHLQHQLATLTTAAPAAPVEQVDKINSNIAAVDQQLEELRQAMKVALTPVANEVNQQLQIARNKYQSSLQRLSQLDAELLELTNKESDLRIKESTCIKTIRSYDSDIVKKKKRAHDLRDYEGLGAFFNSLQVKTCPSCSHEVNRAMVEHEHESGSCRLCSKPVDMQEVEPGTYEAEIEMLLSQADEYRKDQYNYELQRAEATAELKIVTREIQARKSDIAAISLPRLVAEIDAIQQAMLAKPVAFDYEKHLEATTALAVKRAVLVQEQTALSQPAIQPGVLGSLLSQQIEWLTIAQEELGKMRDEKSKGLLEKFEELYLKQLHGFGLTNYEGVVVDEKFKFIYTKAEEPLTFDELTAGEQLRAKLGLYIAMIQMDVQYRYGRHPRFIILDSPAKEEADPTFVDALKQILSYIEAEMGEELQVFVGTAVRPLANAVDSTKVDARSPADPSGKKQYFF